MGVGFDVLDCEGRSAGQELFIEQLGDKARFTMDKCPGEDLLSLVLGFFTEEDQKLTVEEDLLPARLAAGVQQRRSCAQHPAGVARCADAATGNQCGGVTSDTEIGRGTGVGGISEAQQSVGFH